MAQPPSLKDPNFHDHVCHLKKAIYGLKQTPRAWNTELCNYLLSVGFTNAISDTPLFFTKSTTSPIYVLVYVDDIIVLGPSTTLVTTFKDNLAKHFSLKDLGLNYFLGVEVQPCVDKLVFNQRKYTIDLLDRAYE